MKYKLGIVADDITGASNIGGMLALKKELKVNLHTYDDPIRPHEGDVMIIDSDSRFLDSETAYERVYKSTKLLRKLGCERYFKKTCTVFRGNVGAELDGMLDALGEEFAALVVGVPDNNRFTLDSNQYVGDILSKDTNLRNDPMNPVKESNLVEILKKQTKRRVTGFYYLNLDKDIGEIKKIINELKEDYNYIIFDVRNNKDLEKLSQVLKDEKVLGGASGIGRYLGNFINSSVDDPIKPPGKVNNHGVLGISASVTPQTKGQLAYTEERGTRLIEMNPIYLLNEGKDKYIKEIIEKAVDLIEDGRDVLVHSSNSRKDIKEMKGLGKALGMTELEISKLISENLASISKEIIDETKINRVITAGGDTSISFLKELGISSLRIYEQVVAGISSTISLGHKELFLILKSGSFGDEDFIDFGISYLKTYKDKEGDLD